jgi:methanol:N,N-dimethyl-4-nitrosoaniline oxidoreductase
MRRLRLHRRRQPHDCAKGARIVAAHDGRNTNEFQGEAKSEKLENPPQIAINTTVGTGSETTPFYVITDTTSEKAPHK